jgi:thymidylate synthase
MRFDLTHGFPAVTTKKLAWSPVVAELLWFLEGSTDERRLAEIQYNKPREELIGKTTIWTANADAQGVALGYENTEVCKELGPIYSYQWRSFGGDSWKGGDNHGIDQIAWLINEIKTNPDSRRLIVSAWDAQNVSSMALPPCHTMFQFYVQDGKLSCQLYQRSADLPLGTPFNIASYALLTHIIAQLCDLQVGEFVYTLGDAHIYHNQIPSIEEQLTRSPMPLPNILMPEFNTLEQVLLTQVQDYVLENYQCHPALKIPFAV